MAGSVSEGCVEGAAAEAVLAARRGGYREVVRYGISDERAADVGLSCGGIIDVLVEPEIPPEVLAAAAADLDAAVASPLPVGREAAVIVPRAGGRDAAAIVPRAGGREAAVTVPLPAGRERVVLDATGIRSGSLGDPAADNLLAELVAPALLEGVSRTVQVGERAVFVEVVAAQPRLVVVGAGEIAVQLVRLAHALGFRTVVVDARSAFATRERFPDADEIHVGWADELADRAGIDAGAHVVVLAHDPKLDDPALVTALRRGSRYVGALGSRRTQAARRARLREAGIDDAELDRIHGPIGLDLGGRAPAEIALAILAEIVAERHGAPGGRRVASSR